MNKNQKYAELAAKANVENKVIYQHENGDYELVSQIIYQTCKFDGKKWVEDIDKLAKYNKAIIDSNKQQFTSLLDEANNHIDILQDVIDLEIQESNEEEQLKSWKKYRILLTRIDTSQLDITWPEKP